MATNFSIANLFRPTQQVTQAPTQQQPTQQPTQQPAPTGKPGSSLEPQGSQQGQQSVQQGTQTANSPLDAFQDLWKNDPTKQGATDADPFNQPLFNSDPEKLRQAAGQMNFLQNVDQALLQKVMAGGSPQDLLQLINAVGQQTLATAMQLTTATTEHAGRTIGQRFNTALPARFKDMQLQNQAPTNPALNHPAAQPMLQAVQQRIKMQNPDMAPAQIQKMAEDYLSNFATALQTSDPNAPKPVASPFGDDQQDFNWEEWANK